MNLNSSIPSLSRPVVLVCAGLFLAAGALPAAEPKEAPLENNIDFAYGYVDTDGHSPAFQKHNLLDKNGFGGVEDLYLTKSLNDTTTLVLKGRALAGNNDYLFDLTVTKDDVGFVKLGYKEFRVWYDGRGGYLPSRMFTRSLYDEDLAIDRGNLWFEAGFLPEDKPHFNVRYDLFTRKGTKSSTSWGDTGLAVNAANTRGLLPTFLGIDEKRHQLSADVSQAKDNSAWALGVRVDQGDYTNSRNINRRAGEAGLDRKITAKEGQDYDLFQVRGSYENKIHDKLMVTTAVATTTIDTTLSGSRIYGADYDPVYDGAFVNRQQRDEGFFALHGKSEMKQTIGTLSARYQPRETLVIVPSVRFETIDWTNEVEFEETNFGGGTTRPPAVELVGADSEKDWEVVAASIETRYTGIKKVSLNFKADWTDSEGDLTEERILEPGTTHAIVSIDRDTRFERMSEKYAATATWYVMPGTTVAAQYYYKVRTNDYRNTRDNTVSSADRYPAYLANQDFETNDFNVRLSTKLGAQLRSVTRYDYQDSSITSQDIGLAFNESGSMTTHIISETISWTPRPRWYVQGAANMVWDTLRTPAAPLTGAAGGLVKNSDANYIYLSLGGGYVLDEQSDVYFDYAVTESKDSFVDNSNRTVAYGSDAKTQLASVTWTRRLDRRTSVTLKYAYAKNDDVPNGGYADYEAHMLYGKLQYRF
ncbi:hypothetical protein Verru16b_03346 [Lacunisphaera limnophila]|uniref:Uncharacterized protein n=1 Tax=Lacunisphaera limnophila TaxID=1838286 RepID=A0A1D8AZE3_9BACT|nr:hypothetical protein [Lacunisphaera limnophila]AOS46247.1 hypothetical protein Verru16b_03346 [Lacunisphaera limnophila]